MKVLMNAGLALGYLFKLWVRLIFTMSLAAVGGGRIGCPLLAR
jgi:hypothetical protein